MDTAVPGTPRLARPGRPPRRGPVDSTAPGRRPRPRHTEGPGHVPAVRSPDCRDPHTPHAARSERVPPSFSFLYLEPGAGKAVVTTLPFPQTQLFRQGDQIGVVDPRQVLFVGAAAVADH